MYPGSFVRYRPTVVSDAGGRQTEHGFSLVELMVSLVLLGILLGIAIPSYRSLIAEQRIRTTMADLHSALALVRSEAVKRNRSMTLTCIDDSWTKGWRVASPVSGQPDLLNHGQTIDVAIEGKTKSVVFSASGRVSSAVTFQVSSLASEGDSKTSCLFIGLDGRVSSSKGECS